MKIFSFFLILVLPIGLFAQTPEEQYLQAIEDGLYGEEAPAEFLSNEVFVEEDFDGDGLIDQVSVSLFGDGTRELNVVLSAGVPWVNSMILLGPEEGGIFGDPLDNIYLNEEGNLVISFFGGSREKWYMQVVASASFGDIEVVEYTSGWFDSYDESAGEETTWDLYTGAFTNESGQSLGNYFLPEPMFLEYASLSELEDLIYAARAGDFPQIPEIYNY